MFWIIWHNFCFLKNNDVLDLLKEKNLVSAYAEEPPLSPLLTEENQQMNCSPEYVIIIIILIFV